MKSEIIAALITVGGSVLTFALASWFSLISRNADDKRYLCHQLLYHRFKFYEELLFWLPVEQLTKVIKEIESKHIYLVIILVKKKVLIIMIMKQFHIMI